MDIIDKIKNRFKDKPSTEGIDEALLWASIEQNLATPKKKRRKLLFFILPFGALFISALTAITFFNFPSTEQANNPNPINQNTATNTLNNKIISDEIDCDTDKNTLAIEEKKTASSTIFEIESTADKNISETESSIKKPSENQLASNKNAQLAIEKNTAKSTLKSSNEITLIKKETNSKTSIKNTVTQTIANNTETEKITNPLNPRLPINATIDNEQIVFVPNINKTNKTDLEPISSVSTPSKSASVKKENSPTKTPQKSKTAIAKKLTKLAAISSINKIENSPIRTRPKINKPPSRQHKIPAFGNKKSTFQIGLLAGINFSKPYFTKQTSTNDSEFINQLKKSHKTGIGRTIALHFSWQAKKLPLVIGSGLNYADIEHRFNITLSADSTYTNANNILVNGIAIRNVQHFNHYRTISLPIEVGSFISKKRFTYGLNIGIGFNFLTNVSGKSLSGFNTINEISFKDANSPNFNQFFISAYLSPTISYRLNKRFLLQAKPSIQYLHNGQSKFHNVKHYNLLYDFKLGVIVEL